ncbi:FtsK/SpoIIIE domain-containing protein [Promicromonospora sukumoe]|uniref:S-DNA-T family DNA segregation ATPase FtsK/SpoIIIE n=1 Tax=Promicromonospora sukumoe TaxID=88382 RepID=A0A7W3PFZ3_9MICO|nr:FtsK/SpoIIIE domain-containing protein [Promicromonospora sukumoe]MBA8810645.1 S-DNA-T family DNA segregation ATPase FtsK/SpoIIIE [Promicromonospora sukumoe]
MTTPNEHEGGYPPDDASEIAELEALLALPSGPEAVGESIADATLSGADANTLDQGRAASPSVEVAGGEVGDEDDEYEDDDAPGGVLALLDGLRSLTGRAPSVARREVDQATSWLGSNWVLIPLYPLIAVVLAPYGAGLLAQRHWTWVWDLDYKTHRAERRKAARAAGEDAEIRKDYAALLRARWFATVGLSLAGFVGALLFIQFTPWWATWAALFALVGSMGGYGIARAPWLAKATGRKAKAPTITIPFVTEALATLGISPEPSKRGLPGLEILGMRTLRGGVEVLVDLPPGKTAEDVVKLRNRLASALRRQKGCVWPSGDTEVHEARLVLFISDKPLHKRDAVKWKHAKSGATNVFEPIALAEDVRHRDVTATLMFNSGIIGAVPRMGKTLALRTIGMAMALDPRVEIHAYDLKATGDLDSLGPIAHALRVGDSTDDMKFIRDDLKRLVEDRARRAATIRGLSVKEKKITSDIADQHELGLHPIGILIDECHIAFTDATYGKEIAALCEDLVKRGPATGIMLWLATQEPNNDMIPASISRACTYRWCLMVMDWRANDVVLGNGAHAAGFAANNFTTNDKGLAYFRGEGESPALVRGAYIDIPTSEKIVERALIARTEGGWLSGMAAGEIAADDDRSTILHHLIAVWPENDPAWPNGKVWSEVLAERLAEHKPTLYDGWNATQVNSAARRHGVKARDVKGRHNGTEGTRKGLVRAEIVTELGTDTTTED